MVEGEKCHEGGKKSETTDKVKEMGKSRMGGDGRDEI